VFWPQVIPACNHVLPVAADPFGVWGRCPNASCRMQAASLISCVNLGGAIGIALIDTVLYDETGITRTPFESGFWREDMTLPGQLDWTRIVREPGLSIR